MSYRRSRSSSFPAARDPPTPHGPVESLEQRILELIEPFRDHITGYESPDEKAKALILCRNIAFLIRHRFYGTIISEDISMATHEWAARVHDGGLTEVGFFVNADKGHIRRVVGVRVPPHAKVLDELALVVDEQLQEFFQRFSPEVQEYKMER